MVKRPVFVPLIQHDHLVEEIEIEFDWNPGFSPIQKKKNVNALHEAAKRNGLYPLLEVSTKSDELLGQRLSAFSLKIETDIGPIIIESAFQGSKVFEKGGPYTDLYKKDSREAKKDIRIKSSGKLVGFNFMRNEWPLVPKTVFYDWLYLKALQPHQEYLERLFKYKGFTDIEFNPKKSINCQARACALLVSLMKLGFLENALISKNNFIDIVSIDSLRKRHSSDLRQGKLYNACASAKKQLSVPNNKITQKGDVMSNGESRLDELVQIKRPLLILAGPGMGKTYALARKINYLVKEEKVYPDHITVISFTNEAATNMRKKIGTKADLNISVEQKLQPSTICTMHKLCHKIIKDNFQKVNLERGFKVIPVDLRPIIASDCAQLVGAKRKDAKETLICRQEGKCKPTESLKCRICDEYKNLLRRFNYIDFDDQIFLSTKILRENPQILKTEQKKAEFLLVDEYQDINYAQWELIKLLSSKNPNNLFVVGDDYQSIYGFRGGDPKYIRNFAKDYAPNGIVRNLTKNWRCPPNIFKGAFCMAQKYNGGYPDLLEKITFAEESNVRIKHHTFDHHNPEANFIARTINEIGPSHDTLILVPSAYYSSPIKRELRKKFINFSCEFDIENTDFYLICLLLRWLKEPTDNFNFRMLIEEINKDENITNREKALQHVSNCWNEIGERRSLYTRLKLVKNDALLTKLIDVITELRKSQKKDAPEFISTILEKLHLWQDMSSFTKEIISIVEEMRNLSISLRGCSVRILTMKKAKGLEADYVFIVGVENNILPYKGADEDKKKEDSRLLYVSMTRAKKELFILHSKVRDRDITKVALAGRSEFIDAIPSSYIVEES